MVKTYSKMLPLGSLAPDFLLPDVKTGEWVGLKGPADTKATVIMFLCNHCPFVKHVNAELVQIAKDYLSKGVYFIAISSNDVEKYPEDSPENMKITAENLRYPFPYLYDETQDVAKAYQAACTPDFFIFNASQQLIYRGQLDDSRPGNNLPVDGYCIRNALDCVLRNQPITIEQKPSMGCNIKWKEPS